MDILQHDGLIAISVTVAVFVGLLLGKRGLPADLLFLGGLVAVTLTGVISPRDALHGFANPAVITIGSLFVVSAGLRTTGVLDWVGQKLLGTAQHEGAALRRLALTVVPVSAFLLNTPLVAMLAPVVVDWCRRRGVSPSRLLIPLSYLAILGGVCTLIGTTTTLVVNAWLRNLPAEGPWNGGAQFREQLAPMSLFELGWAGLPCAVVGMLYLLTIGHRLLPNRVELIERLGKKRREYLVEMLVRPQCPLVGKSVESAGLRQLPGLFLIEIERKGELITPVIPQHIIQADDRLVFTGVVTTIVDLEKIPGLVPAADLTYEVAPHQRRHRQLTEVVISRTSPVVGRAVKDADFRARYNAAIVAVHRNGLRLTNKIGNIRLEPGDTLLLQTNTNFVSRHRHDSDFYLVGNVGDYNVPEHDRASLSAGLFVALILWMSLGSHFRQHAAPPPRPLPVPQQAAPQPAAVKAESRWTGWTSTAIAALAVAGLMVVTRCLTMAQARAAIDLQVLMTIAGALALGAALEQSGAARVIADWMVHSVQVLFADHPEWIHYVLLAVVYLLAMVFTEMITNVAVAAMFLPLAVQIAASASISPRPFVIAIALAASLSFMTPIGYQTNLMVMGPGGYRPRDYFKIGAPLALLMVVTAVIFIPRNWPFVPPPLAG